MTVRISDDATVRHIVIDRPDRLNAVNEATLRHLSEAVTAAGEDPTVRVIVISGAGRAFCSGGDLDVDDPFAPETTERTIDAAAALITAIRSVPRPVVAEIRGPAVGVGVSIALAADLAIARSDAYFTMPFTAIGLMPDGGATALVAAAAGRAVAMRLFALGGRMTAHDAERHGLIAAVLPAESFDADFAAALANLRTISLAAFARTKSALDAATLPHLGAAFEHERRGQRELAGGKDFRAAVTAFTAGRGVSTGGTPPAKE
ncbi:enoyl-CoA hydratase-related protein [Nocardia sp. alder85J]|uniref:enoyl-CoA hydratase-related protein n=1 Tax=Nocardia sp. alder85J TaxID=2862949 RepID=UPI001CD4EB8F|nr:enoyl-CoA hydratase-related protein [Nocardia sp. alder85J]MCX4095816.1 enoyl-CoA hydratase-related protein [Nocardia sp. alder85J]